MSLSPPPDDAALAPTLLLCRIIAGAMTFGVVAFATVAIVLRLGEPAEAARLLSLIGAIGGFVLVLVRQLIVGLLGGRAASLKPGQPYGAFAPYVSRMIVGLAILEGAAFFNLVCYLIEGHWWSLAVVGVLLVLMLAAFPTRTRLRYWLADREQLQTFGSG